jgi:beta-phosphoglucomutase-like phosphatase (HAD superfamily)
VGKGTIQIQQAISMKRDGALGAIFDWDGVIVDSSLHHEESWERLALETGFSLPEGHFKKGFGMKRIHHPKCAEVV